MMNRGDFIASGAAMTLVAATSDPFTPTPGPWRTYTVTTTVTFQGSAPVQAWIPVASFTESDWMKVESEPRGLFAHVQVPAGDKPRTFAVVSRVSTRDLAVDLSKPGKPAPLSDADRARYLAPTTNIPTDGIVKQTADKITAGASTDLDKAQRIYAWIVANTYRKPTTRGCGLGDVSFLLETGDLGGKCADINGLAVGLLRASGIPARDIYGIRVAPSRFGYKSLGANSSTITKAQHCRAEAYLADYGWVPMDPADVRKVILEEPPGNLAAGNPKVVDARETLFGAWEGNYMAYNDAADVVLPGSSGKPVPFLMYPQAEVNGERLDSLDPATFIYTIDVA
jgi:transglutaminase-like putative cysteine protease